MMNEIQTMIKECKKSISIIDKANELYQQGEFVNAKKWFKEALQNFHDIYHDAMLLLYKKLSDIEYSKLCDILETVSDYITETRKCIVNCDYIINGLCH